MTNPITLVVSTARSALRQVLLAVAFGVACTFLQCNAAFAATDPPVISPGTGGTYGANQTTITISSDNVGATYIYTTDGSTPTGSHGTTYSAAFTVNSLTTVQAIAIVSGVSSTVTTAFIQVEVPRTNLQLWLKPENLITSGSNITGYTDVSGYSTVVSQSTSANQPTLVTGALNGYNASNFNGATSNSSYLNITSGSTGTGGAPFLKNLTGGVAIFAVVNVATSSAAKCLFTASNTGITDMTALQTNGSNMIFNINNGTTQENLTTTNTPVTPGTFQVIDAWVDPTNGNLGSDDAGGISAATAALQALNNTTRSVTYIGGDDALTSGAFWGGQLVEMLVYSTGSGFAPDVAQINAYLAQRYQINTSQVTPAPVISLPTSTLSAPAEVAISAIPTATIRVTTDGSTPSSSSPVYSQPLLVSFSQQVKAIAIVNGISSSVASSTFTLDSTQWPAPSASNTTAPLLNLQIPTVSIPQ